MTKCDIKMEHRGAISMRTACPVVAMAILFSVASVCCAEDPQSPPSDGGASRG